MISDTRKQGKDVYSNFDHKFQLPEKEIRNMIDFFFTHRAYNFIGHVYWDNETNQFKEEIWVHHKFRILMTSETLEDLIKNSCDMFGRN